MTDFLVFTLYAPLSSWGDTAVGEVRSAWDRPSRSAILGIVAAALGLTRDDEAAHAELDAMCGVGVRLALSGVPFTDYHTSQDPTDVAVRRYKPRTRKAALECAEPVTTLSQRTLRQDALSVIAIWERASARWSLGDLVDALRSPSFVLYAGRKANAIGLPLGPANVSFDTLASALASLPKLPREVAQLRPAEGWGREVAYDPCETFESGFTLTDGHVVRRRDARPHRIRWQFAERNVHMGVLPMGAGK